MASISALASACFPAPVAQNEPEPTSIAMLERIETSVTSSSSGAVVVQLVWGEQVPQGDEPIGVRVLLGDGDRWREARPEWFSYPNGHVSYRATMAVRRSDWEKGCWQAIYSLPEITGSAPTECLNRRLRTL